MLPHGACVTSLNGSPWLEHAWMTDLAVLIMLSGALGAVALIGAAHPKVERFVRRLYLR